MAEAPDLPSERTKLRVVCDSLKTAGKNVIGGAVRAMVQKTFKSDFKNDFKSDFFSTCEEANSRLSKLSETYKKFGPLFDQQAMSIAYQQLSNKGVVINFFGAHNCGKSTLLNAILDGKFLPMKDLNETGMRVCIQHLGSCHDSHCHDVEAQEFCKNCPRLLEYGEELEPRISKGVAAIYKRLQELNKTIRCEGLDKMPDCVLQVRVPILSEVPPGYSVSLVDNPGYGETNVHITQLADDSAKISTTDSEFFRKLAEQCPEAISGNRLVIVVTKVDEKHGSIGDVATMDEVREEVCKSIKEATGGKDIPKEKMIILSGLLALESRELLSHNCRQELKEAAAFHLSRSPDFKCGQEEGGLMSLLSLAKEELSVRLERASNLEALVERIKVITSSCVGILASTVGNAYCNFLRITVERLQKHVDTMNEDIAAMEGDYESSRKQHEDINTKRKEVENTESVHQEIQAAVPKDVEITRVKENGKQKSAQLIWKFEMNCKQKIYDASTPFGQQEFRNDLKNFLKNAGGELQKCFNDEFGFSNAQQVVQDQKRAMTHEVNVLRQKVHSLFIAEEYRDLPEAAATPSLPTPDLGQLIKRMCIPSVQLTWWEEIKLLFRMLFGIHHISTTECEVSDSCEPRLEESDEQDCTQEPKEEGNSEYRAWNAHLDQCMETLKEFFFTKCEDLDEIQPKAIQHFCNHYNESMKNAMANFDLEFKPLLDQEAQRLEELSASIEEHKRQRDELKQVCDHLEKLEEHLDEQMSEMVRGETRV